MTTEIFLSYTRSKDRYNYITEFHGHLQTEFQNKSGNRDALIFFDRDHIAGGERFNEKIQEELNSAKILLVLLSPTWINSAYCNKEFEFFNKKKSEKSIVPVLWDQINLEQVNPKYMDNYNLIKTYNWIEWKDLQYENWESSSLRKATGKLAEELNSISLKLK